MFICVLGRLYMWYIIYGTIVSKTPVSPTPLVRTGWDTGICFYFVSGFLLKMA